MYDFHIQNLTESIKQNGYWYTSNFLDHGRSVSSHGRPWQLWTLGANGEFRIHEISIAGMSPASPLFDGFPLAFQLQQLGRHSCSEGALLSTQNLFLASLNKFWPAASSVSHQVSSVQYWPPGAQIGLICKRTPALPKRHLSDHTEHIASCFFQSSLKNPEFVSAQKLKGIINNPIPINHILYSLLIVSISNRSIVRHVISLLRNLLGLYNRVL